MARASLSPPWWQFVTASALHVGAAAAAVSLRRDLVGEGSVSDAAFDEAYAVSRLTPGTNLLALNVVLGRYLAGWWGGIGALALATTIPSIIACVAASIYLRYSTLPLAAAAMQGARAGALAVFAWAAVRLLRPQLARFAVRGACVAVGAAVFSVAVPVPQILLLLGGGLVGALLLRGER